MGVVNLSNVTDTERSLEASSGLGSRDDIHTFENHFWIMGGKGGRIQIVNVDGKSGVIKTNALCFEIVHPSPNHFPASAQFFLFLTLYKYFPESSTFDGE